MTVSENKVTSFRCRVCGHVGEAPASLEQERMFGLGHKFTYRTCGQCGCMQIESIPGDMAPYYRNYYSNVKAKGLRERLIRWRDLAEAGERNWTGKLLAMRWRQLDLRLLRPLLRNRNQRVLDVGCGEGTFLRLLRDMGFHHLTGVDPFTEAPTAAGTSPHIVRSELSELPGVFDLIFLHHSLEHLPDQLAALREVRERLQPGGLAVIRIPVVDSWAARQYGSNWVALDAPRHLYLHTRESLRIAASSAGLMVTGWAYDSTGFQFWGSEQYKLGHPLAPAGSIGIHPKSGLFTSAQLRAWERAAHRLNSWGLGDTVIAVMQHADETENLISGWGAALST